MSSTTFYHFIFQTFKVLWRQIGAKIDYGSIIIQQIFEAQYSFHKSMAETKFYFLWRSNPKWNSFLFKDWLNIEKLE